MSHRIHAVFLLTIACTLMGCGSGAYLDQMQQSATEAKQGFASLSEFYGYYPEPLQGTGVNFRQPRVFEAKLTVGEEDPMTGYAAAEQTLWPTKEPLPGYHFTLQGEVTTSKRYEYPYNVYVAVTAEENAEEALETIKNELATIEPPVVESDEEDVEDVDESADVAAEAGDTADDDESAEAEGLTWEETTIEGPTGESRSWKTLRKEGQYFFQEDRRGEGNWIKFNGVVKMYAYQGQNHLVILGWKARDEDVDSTNIDQLVKTMASTLYIDDSVEPAISEPEIVDATPKPPTTQQSQPPNTGIIRTNPGKATRFE